MHCENDHTWSPNINGILATICFDLISCGALGSQKLVLMQSKGQKRKVFYKEANTFRFPCNKNYRTLSNL